MIYKKRIKWNKKNLNHKQLLYFKNFIAKINILNKKK
jgi:hypothetical protein